MKTIRVTTQDLLDKVLALRNEVFVNEQGVDPQIEQDPFDTIDNPLVDHFALVIKDDIVIGTCRCIHTDSQTIRLGRFAIDHRLRHQGFGIKFLKIICDYYYQKQIESVIIHAQNQAVSFYTSAGFKPFGKPFLEAGIEHQSMRYILFQHFYTRFANVYDEIFPLSGPKKSFLEDFLKDKNSLLDVGCATGEALHLAKSLNIDAMGIDLDNQMIFIAHENKNLNAVVMNMKDVKSINQSFDSMICLGNTLVHLDNENEINQFLSDAYQLLKPNGELCIQIINYDRILSKKIMALPKLSNPSKTIFLERNYEQNDKHIIFKNTLTIAKKQYLSSVQLFPIMPKSLKQLALNNKFKVLKEYGNYKKDPFDKNESVQYLIYLKK